MRDNLPQQQARLRIEAGAGFVQEQHLRVGAIMARAMERRCIMPPEKVRAMWSARSVSLTCRATPAVRRSRSPGALAEVGA